MPSCKKVIVGWSDGYFPKTVSKHDDESIIRNYVKNQSNNYEQMHSNHPLVVF